ncbi:sigma-E factor negative regulatory protein [Variovorax sp. LjRoot290]|uniref:RseA family anti-sigma factor n=1 Tax=unclassified Variovorax TaxID=663243 RepID=UPI003ECD44BF
MATRIRRWQSPSYDGQLREDELAQAVGTVCSDEELRATWRTYQLVGEVLRSGVHPACSAPVLSPEALLAEPRDEVANEPVLRGNWWQASHRWRQRRPSDGTGSAVRCRRSTSSSAPAEFWLGPRGIAWAAAVRRVPARSDAGRGRNWRPSGDAA